jgi:hypothetical protein
MILTSVFICPIYEAYKYAKEHIINTTQQYSFSVVQLYIIYDVVAEITCKIKHICLKKYVCMYRNYF